MAFFVVKAGADAMTDLLIQSALALIVVIPAWHLARRAWRAVFPRMRKAHEG